MEDEQRLYKERILYTTWIKNVYVQEWPLWPFGNQTLKAVAKSSGKGSVIAVDFYSKAFITGETSSLMKYGSIIYKITDESFKFGIDTKKNSRENVETLLQEAGFTLRELRLLGKTTEKVKPFGGLVEAVKM